jgi:tripartite-type tricarboxylate transporter receptor subunit TctC
MIVRTLHKALGLALAALLSGSALAQSFPTKPVRIVVPYGSGSGPEIVARLIGEKLKGYWGQPIIVEAKPGGNGVIALEEVKRSDPDGHTISLMDTGIATINANLFKDISYDVPRDFQPAAMLFNVHFFVTVGSKSPISSFNDLMKMAKEKPGQVTYATPYIGSPQHLSTAHLELLTGTKMLQVPFKEQSQLFTSVANGEVTWTLGSIGSLLPFINSQRVKLLAVAGPKRLPGQKEIPTVAEVGGPKEFEAAAWVGLFITKNSPASAAEIIHRDVARAVAEPDLNGKFSALGFAPWNISRQEISAVVASDIKRYAQMIKATGARAE